MSGSEVSQGFSGHLWLGLGPLATSYICYGLLAYEDYFVVLVFGKLAQPSKAEQKRNQV